MKDNISDFLEGLTRTSTWSKPGGSHDFMLLLGAILLPVAIVAIWAIYFRRRPRVPNGLVEAPRHRRKRRQGRVSKRRNPTLAETGGLPPARHDKHVEA